MGIKEIWRRVSAGSITPDYLKAMAIPLRRGRYFEQSDSANSMPVAIINETMARTFWRNKDALGKRFRLAGDDASFPWLTIVGIVGDVRNMGLEAPVKAEMYIPVPQASEEYAYYSPRDRSVPRYLYIRRPSEVKLSSYGPSSAVVMDNGSVRICGLKIP